MAKKKVGRAARKPAPTRGVLTEVRITPGPRKKVEGPPPPRYTTHKIRAVWFQARASYPIREANVEKLVAERGRVQPAIPPPAVNWVLAGPTNIGGRTTA